MSLAIEPAEALKWIAVIFIAGFIGYFGKYLSKIIIAKMHKKGPEGKQQPEKPSGKSREEMDYELQKKKRELDYEMEKKRLKLEKKRIKAEKKAKK